MRADNPVDEFGYEVVRLVDQFLGLRHGSLPRLFSA
jgi:hypothetical protein